MEKLYKIRKTYESPTEKIYKGVVKTEEEWKKHFSNLQVGDCKVKTDWFMCVGTTVSANSNAIFDIRRKKEQFIAFAKFAKSYCTPKSVEDAFEAWINRK